MSDDRSKALRERGIIGRESFLMEKVALLVHKHLSTRFDYTPIHETRRGYTFSVAVTDSDGVPTGHVARVTVELDRFDESLIPGRESRAS